MVTHLLSDMSIMQSVYRQYTLKIYLFLTKIIPSIQKSRDLCCTRWIVIESVLKPCFLLKLEWLTGQKLA